MAKTSDLASLAALGALGYMLTRNGDKVDLNQQSSGDSNPTRGAGYNSTETRNSPDMGLKTQAQSIADADVSNNADSIISKGPSGTTTPGPAAQSSTGTTTLGPDYSGDIVPAVKSKAVKSKDVKGSNLAAATPQKKTKTMYPSGVMGGARLPTSASNKTRANTDSDRVGTAVPISDIYSEADKSPSPYQRPIIKDDGRGSRIEDQIRQNMNSAGMKKGGAVKMASGGMTASSRGDGIATKGKTRGKIC